MLTVYLSVGAPLAAHAIGGVVTHRAIVATDRCGTLAAAAAAAGGAHLARIKVAVVVVAALIGAARIPLAVVAAGVTALGAPGPAAETSEGCAALPAVYAQPADRERVEHNMQR